MNAIMSPEVSDPDAPDQLTSEFNLDRVGRIAAALGLPRAAFFRADPCVDPQLQMLDDTAELIRLFSLIDDRPVRLRVIAVASAAANGNDPIAAFAVGAPV